ncbi:MAG: TetR/AcrR family transcriptional regulator [Bacteroidales bacterium]|nr:TetR/AcrR family transcriptional regulator [Bacteroidales bacterium]
MRRSRKEEICSVALKLFAEKGYHATSIANIAKEAGISKGLLYNYFQSKEHLLSSIFANLTDKIMTLLNPNSDNEISLDEAEGFFDKFFQMLVENPIEWKLFFQISMQNEVLQLLLKETNNENVRNSQLLIVKFFNSNGFEDPEIALILFSSIIKGFTMQYCLAPELFNNEMLEKFKILLKDMFLKRRKGKTGKNAELNDSMGYILL